jgi:hypothetical protein
MGTTETKIGFIAMNIVSQELMFPQIDDYGHVSHKTLLVHENLTDAPLVLPHLFTSIT